MMERSEIGHAVWMMLFGWKASSSGRGFWRREVKRLASDPTVYEAEVKLNPHPAEPGPKFLICWQCGLEINDQVFAISLGQFQPMFCSERCGNTYDPETLRREVIEGIKNHLL